ncbi:MAG: class I SAM-dependent methyltransferase [Deltaproteobacteria bacterium]|nr:class I SAM-dependent methyltransferase [Deltaproteobacteria bacterium]
MSWRAHPLCASAVVWPARFWGPEPLDPTAWRELAARLDPADEIAALLAALAGRDREPRVILDVGGGTGLLTRAIAARFGACTVIEPAVAQLRALPAGLAIVRGRAEALPIGDRAVDAAVATWVLQYTADPAAAVAELARVVGDGGTVAIVQAAPANDLVAAYNTAAAIAGMPPAHHGWLLALAAEVLADAGFAVALTPLAIGVACAPSIADAAALADTIARLHFADHPALAAMIAAITPALHAAAARGVRDDGVLLTARLRKR